MKNPVTKNIPRYMAGSLDDQEQEPGFVGVVDHINKGGADEFFTPEMEHKFRTASY
jgi:hypothetical protein